MKKRDLRKIRWGMRCDKVLIRKCRLLVRFADWPLWGPSDHHRCPEYSKAIEAEWEVEMSISTFNNHIRTFSSSMYE